MQSEAAAKKSFRGPEAKEQGLAEKLGAGLLRLLEERF